MNAKILIGKTITSARIRKRKGFDDTPYLDLTFSDGTKITIIAGYGGYTGSSYDEYPCFIYISETSQALKDEKDETL